MKKDESWIMKVSIAHKSNRLEHQGIGRDVTLVGGCHIQITDIIYLSRFHSDSHLTAITKYSSEACEGDSTRTSTLIVLVFQFTSHSSKPSF